MIMAADDNGKAAADSETEPTPQASDDRLQETTGVNAERKSDSPARDLLTSTGQQRGSTTARGRDAGRVTARAVAWTPLLGALNMRKQLLAAMYHRF